jgi:hypothetical protein
MSGPWEKYAAADGPWTKYAAPSNSADLDRQKAHFPTRAEGGHPDLPWYSNFFNEALGHAQKLTDVILNTAPGADRMPDVIGVPGGEWEGFLAGLREAPLTQGVRNAWTAIRSRMSQGASPLLDARPPAAPASEIPFNPFAGELRQPGAPGQPIPFTPPAEASPFAGELRQPTPTNGEIPFPTATERFQQQLDALPKPLARQLAKDLKQYQLTPEERTVIAQAAREAAERKQLEEALAASLKARQ